ncbi:helix-turn-helix domain-containing protein [Paenibacillus filicis]|uniref:Helix-turn-helix domain-containing protein n=1 Tax=Paenibacillus gyeongsangnamensis TaxID=3388067 RepID=A0ABT4QLP3_9BACL|nr:helix-turn-helix domain-containing protein [Paenibacillus filicis]MCZ8517732.1 helix-turn-helix domain-containing protein [Paenibacillus filicis]
MEENVNHSNMAMLDQLKEMMDNQFNEVDQLANQIMSVPKLPVLLNAQTLGSQELYNFLELRTELERYRKSRLISDLYLYFAGSDTILTPNLRTDSRTFFNKIYRSKEMSYEKWKELVLGGFHYRTYFPSTPIITASGTENMISYVTSLPLGETKDRKGSLVFLINENEVARMLANTKLTKDSSVFIVNLQQEMIEGPGTKSGIFNELKSKLVKNNDIFAMPYHGEEFIVSYTTSKQLGWKYVSVTPTKLFMERVLALKLWGVVLLLICLTAGIVGCYLLAYRNYSPIRELVHAVKGKSKAQTQVQTLNEFDYIKQTIQFTLDEDNQLRGFLSQQIPMIQANFLMRLLGGYVERSTITEHSLDFMNIRFVSDQFAVVLLEIYDLTQFTAEESERQWALARFIIANIMSELANASHLGYTLELNRNRIALLFNVNEAKDCKAEEDLKQIVEALKQVVEHRFKILLTVSVSSMHTGVERVSECYREALDALDYQIVLGLGKILYFNEIPLGQQHYYYPIEVEVQLINYVKSADTDQVLSLLDRIYSINFESHHISPELGKRLFFNIQSTVLKILNSMNLKFEHGIEDRLDPMNVLSNCTTAEEMHRRTSDLFRELCHYIKSDKSDHSEQLLQEICAYIQEHFGDGLLSLTSIADHKGITSQYLSNFFKKHQGQNLSDYIAQIRLQHAKRFLKDPSLPISEIAALVGYASDIAFIRFFKKYEGITPGKYRETIRLS